jgi:hypothetical protein
LGRKQVLPDKDAVTQPKGLHPKYYHPGNEAYYNQKKLLGSGPKIKKDIRPGKVWKPKLLGSGKRAAPKRHHVSGYMRPKKVVKRSKK